MGSAWSRAERLEGLDIDPEDDLEGELPRVSHEQWTDAEWLAVIRKFSPDVRTSLAEEWVYEERVQAEHQELQDRLADSRRLSDRIN